MEKLCKIFAKLFEKFKEDMKDIQNLALSNKNNQIKGEKQLINKVYLKQIW